MIVLDTNVISETMRVRPDQRVVHWLDRQSPSSLFLSVITVDEIACGIAILPAGRKRTGLARGFDRIVDAFVGRLLPLDSQAARASAEIRARRRRSGQPISLADAQIAGIAKSNGHAIATLNTRDFDGVEVEVVEPR